MEITKHARNTRRQDCLRHVIRFYYFCGWAIIRLTMPELPPEQVTPFVFSDPSGKRWPRLRLILLIGGVLFFVALVLFVQTLFVIPKMNVPFSLRQLKGQLRALQRENPAGQVSTASLLWQKFSAARQAAKKLAGTAPAS